MYSGFLFGVGAAFGVALAVLIVRNIGKIGRMVLALAGLAAYLGFWLWLYKSPLFWAPVALIAAFLMVWVGLREALSDDITSTRQSSAAKAERFLPSAQMNQPDSNLRRQLQG